MFEKEAEERASKLEESQTLGVYDNDEDYERDRGWNQGEVAGYEEGFKDGAEFGYNKANEWHKVEVEGLPINNNDDTTYLLYTIYGEGGSPVVAHFMYKDKQELMNVWTGAILTEDKIVAWKEIVLPKEIE